MTYYHSIIFTLLNEFYPGFKIKPFNTNEQRPIHGGLSYLNEKCQKKICCDITQLQFNSFYPNIIIKLLELGKSYSFETIDHSDIDPFSEETWETEIIDGIVCNIPEFGELYKFIVENRNEIKKFENEFINKLLKIIINFTYGVFANKYAKIKVREVENITRVGRDIINIFIQSYPNNVISADTDEINFLDFDSIKEDVEKKLKELDYPYEYEKYVYGIFLEKKHFILSNDKDMKIRGLRKISKLESPKERRLTNPHQRITDNPGLPGTSGGIDPEMMGTLMNLSIENNIPIQNYIDMMYPRGVIPGVEINTEGEIDHLNFTEEFIPRQNVVDRYRIPRTFITE